MVLNIRKLNHYKSNLQNNLIQMAIRFQAPTVQCWQTYSSLFFPLEQPIPCVARWNRLFSTPRKRRMGNLLQLHSALHRDCIFDGSRRRQRSFSNQQNLRPSDCSVQNIFSLLQQSSNSTWTSATFFANHFLQNQFSEIYSDHFWTWFRSVRYLPNSKNVILKLILFLKIWIL